MCSFRSVTLRRSHDCVRHACQTPLKPIVGKYTGKISSQQIIVLDSCSCSLRPWVFTAIGSQSGRPEQRCISSMTGSIKIPPGSRSGAAAAALSSIQTPQRLRVHPCSLFEGPPSALRRPQAEIRRSSYLPPFHDQTQRAVRCFGGGTSRSLRGASTPILRPLHVSPHSLECIIGLRGLMCNAM